MGMVVIRAYILVSKLKKTKTKFLRCTAVKKHVIKYFKKVYERSSKTYFGLLKIHVKF